MCVVKSFPHFGECTDLWGNAWEIFIYCHETERDQIKSSGLYIYESGKSDENFQFAFPLPMLEHKVEVRSMTIQSVDICYRFKGFHYSFLLFLIFQRVIPRDPETVYIFWISWYKWLDFNGHGVQKNKIAIRLLDLYLFQFKWKSLLSHKVWILFILSCSTEEVKEWLCWLVIWV